MDLGPGFALLFVLVGLSPLLAAAIGHFAVPGAARILWLICGAYVGLEVINWTLVVVISRATGMEPGLFQCSGWLLELGAPLLAIAIVPVVGTVLAARAARRTLRHCIRCGYPLQNLESPRCPECGTIHAPPT